MNNVSSSKYLLSFHLLLYALHSLIVASGFSVIYIYIFIVCCFMMCLFLLCRTVEIGADRFKIPDVLFNPSLVQVWDLHSKM